MKVQGRLVVGCICLLLAFFCFAGLEQSQAGNIFDQVDQSKNSSKSSSSTSSSPSSAGSSATTNGVGAAFPINVQPSTYPANSQAGSGYPASGQPGTEYPITGSRGFNSVGGRPVSGIKNSINSGIQNNLQRGINRGAGALDRYGQKIGLPGLGTMLSSPNGQSNQGGGSTYSNIYPPYTSPSGQSPPAVAPNLAAPPDDIPYRKHFTPAQIHATSKNTSGKEAYDAVARRARQSQAEVYLKSAQQAEARGDWKQAMFAYREASGGDELIQEDSDLAAKNHTGAVDEMLKRKFRDPAFRQLNLKWAYCAVQLLNQDYAGVKTGIDKKYTEEQLFAAYESLQASDKGNAAWLYLDAVFLCSEVNDDWNYLKAWNKLLDALACPRISPSIREKCLALQKHIAPGKDLQQNDLKRGEFCMQQDIVWNVEHPHIAGKDTWSTTTSIDDRYERVTTYSRDVVNTEYWATETYPVCKKNLAEKYPAFKSAWLKLLNEMMKFPNPAMAVPVGPANEEPALYCPSRWEQIAFGPLDLTIGRKYPRRLNVPGAGHHDRELHPKSYHDALCYKRRGK